MTQKVLIFDSGSLISLSINGLLEELKKLKKIFNGEFIITKEVKKEDHLLINLLNYQNQK